MAARTSCGDYDVDMELSWQPTDIAALVATSAVGRCGDMISRLASRRGSVVATCAVGGRSEWRVIHFGSSPYRGGLVARLTIRCGLKMTSRLTGSNNAVVATGTSRGDDDIDMEFRWQPIRITRSVAGRAIGCGGDVVGSFSRGRRSVMATATAGGCCERAVVDLRTSPGSR
jgi:hypothetical protein